MAIAWSYLWNYCTICSPFVVSVLHVFFPFVSFPKTGFNIQRNSMQIWHGEIALFIFLWMVKLPNTWNSIIIIPFRLNHWKHLCLAIVTINKNNNKKKNRVFCFFRIANKLFIWWITKVQWSKLLCFVVAIGLQTCCLAFFYNKFCYCSKIIDVIYWTVYD